jgi:hypothetical protein
MTLNSWRGLFRANGGRSETIGRNEGMIELDLNPDMAGKILDTLHLINMRKGRGKVTTYSRAFGELNGTAARRIQVSEYTMGPCSYFKFRLFQGKRDGQWRIKSLGLTMKVESV